MWFVDSYYKEDTWSFNVGQPWANVAVKGAVYNRIIKQGLFQKQFGFKLFLFHVDVLYDAFREIEVKDVEIKKKKSKKQNIFRRVASTEFKKFLLDFAEERVPVMKQEIDEYYVELHALHDARKMNDKETQNRIMTKYEKQWKKCRAQPKDTTLYVMWEQYIALKNDPESFLVVEEVKCIHIIIFTLFVYCCLCTFIL